MIIQRWKCIISSDIQRAAPIGAKGRFKGLGRLKVLSVDRRGSCPYHLRGMTRKKKGKTQGSKELRKKESLFITIMVSGGIGLKNRSCRKGGRGGETEGGDLKHF